LVLPIRTVASSGWNSEEGVEDGKQIEGFASSTGERIEFALLVLQRL
jgi:hypothetical protein